jgi:hypothetical protein
MAAVRGSGFWAAVAVIFTAFLAGCGGDSSNNRPRRNADVSGNWHAITTSQIAPTTTDFDMFIVQSGTSLASSLVLMNGTRCASEGTLTGTVDRQAVDFSIRETNGPDTITVPGSTDGVTIAGSYSISGSCDGGDTGSFSADFIPSITSSRWSGGTISVNGTLSFTADLHEDSRGNLSGTMSFSGSPCFSNLMITGNQVGTAVRLRDSQGIFEAFGNTNNQASSISGDYSVLSGPCAEHGTFSMSGP